MSTDTDRRSDLGFRELAAMLGLASWQMRLAREHGLIPEPDGHGRWSAGAAGRCLEGRPTIIERFGEEPPVGARKAAERLALRLGLDVERADIEVLVARGDLTMVGRYQRHPVYLLRDVDDLDPRRVTEVVHARKGPLTDTVDPGGAALALGWPKEVFTRIADERALAADTLGRYALADIRALAADEALTARVRMEKRRRALTRARRNEQRHEGVLRGWILRCTAYLDGTADDPPEPLAAARALRAVMAARSAVALHAT
ncbi:hypothetical protein GCM10023085_76220 [Actinomadura viridis]|uniref:Uncharacterized protein n=1 Tax=Actinomadura viridis TaxID=58110 RepID=A0A931GQV3_9ACTN|nr:hypothetical protein [Actinomadura viridis]MBG6088969.1 hypothetical protein [Actinomadura viridis]